MCGYTNGQKREIYSPEVGPWSYYETRDSSATIQRVQNAFLSGKFKPIKASILNAGIPGQYYWVHFTIRNEKAPADQLFLEIDNARINELELFEVSGDEVQSFGKLGDFFPFSQRPVLHKNFVYQISVPPHKQKDYFLFVNQIGHAFLLPIKAYTGSHFRSNTFRDYLFDGVTYGILLFVAILSFLFFLTARHNLYLYYSLYIITAIAWFMAYFGLGYQYLWGNYPTVNTLMSPLMSSLNILLNLQICQVLLQFSKTNKSLNRVTNYTKYLLMATALFPILFDLNRYGYFLNHGYLIVLLSVILAAMLIVSYSVILYALKGFITARVYLIASLLKAGSIINLALLELGITPAVNNMEELLQCGIFIEITLLTYSLAIRYRNYKARTFVKVIEAHEKERSLISKEIHDSISSSLTGINYGIKNFTRDIPHLPPNKRSQLEKIFDELNKVQLEARNISHNTMPDYIKNSSIADIVEKHVNEIQIKAQNGSGGTSCIKINFSANEQLVNFYEAVKLNIFRIIQEILTNILKHSEATNADILFSFNKKEMLIIVEDNGVGFYRTNHGSGQGMGIKNIRSRVELLDGSISIKSPVYKRSPEPDGAGSVPAAEFGTMVKIRIPYKKNLAKYNIGL